MPAPPHSHTPGRLHPLPACSLPAGAVPLSLHPLGGDRRPQGGLGAAGHCLRSQHLVSLPLGAGLPRRLVSRHCIPGPGRLPPTDPGQLMDLQVNFLAVSFVCSKPQFWTGEFTFATGENRSHQRKSNRKQNGNWSLKLSKPVSAGFSCITLTVVLCLHPAARSPTGLGSCGRH